MRFSNVDGSVTFTVSKHPFMPGVFTIDTHSLLGHTRRDLNRLEYERALFHLRRDFKLIDP